MLLSVSGVNFNQRANKNLSANNHKQAARYNSSPVADSVSFGLNKTSIVKPAAADVVKFLGHEFIKNEEHPEEFLSANLYERAEARKITKSLQEKSEEIRKRLASYDAKHFKEFIEDAINSSEERELYANLAKGPLNDNDKIQYSKYSDYLNSQSNVDKLYRICLNRTNSNQIRIGGLSESACDGSTSRGMDRFIKSRFGTRGMSAGAKVDGKSYVVKPQYEKSQDKGMDFVGIKFAPIKTDEDL